MDVFITTVVIVFSWTATFAVCVWLVKLRRDATRKLR